jgi:hypothetical protein
MVAAILAVCVWVGIWALPASTAVGFAMLTFIVAFTVSMSRLPQRMSESDTNVAEPPSKASVLFSTGVGLCASIVVFAIAGFCEIAGTACWPIVWVSLVTAAIALWLPGRRRRTPALVVHTVQAGTNAQAPTHPAIAEDTIAGMSTHQLCRAWRQSWLMLLDTGLDPTQWIRVAETRRRYLDELERRDPTGFSRWLDSGARAGGNPSKFITPPVHPMDPREAGEGRADR